MFPGTGWTWYSWRASLSWGEVIGKILRQHCNIWEIYELSRPLFWVFPISVRYSSKVLGHLTSVICLHLLQFPVSSRYHSDAFVNTPNLFIWKISLFALLLGVTKEHWREMGTWEMGTTYKAFPSCVTTSQFLFSGPLFALYKEWGCYQIISEVPSSLNNPWLVGSVLPLPPNLRE